MLLTLDQGSCALEHSNTTIVFLQRLCSYIAISVNSMAILIEKPGCFTGMGCENPLCGKSRIMCQPVKPIGIHHPQLFLFNHSTKEHARPFRLTQSWAEG